MSNWHFGERSENHLVGVHPHLEMVARYALSVSVYDFGITQGIRSLEDQTVKYNAGDSLTMKSRHLAKLPMVTPFGYLPEQRLSHAIDFAVYLNGELTWDFSKYHEVADVFYNTAFELSTHVEWGGNWKGIQDGPHIQLPWANYPIKSDG